MNILIPHTWLLKHLKTTANPKQIQNFISLCGPTVESIEKIESEPVYNIEVTTNRVDMMSVYGLAREASVILPEFDISAKLLPLKLNSIGSNRDIDVEIINNPKLCNRILAVKLENVKTSDSPKWLKKRLIQVGQRPLNNVIDITNYCMWEIGHPLHAFDYDAIKTKKIVVRLALEGESIITLDEKKHELKGGEVVFDDGKGNIIDLPGVMGAKNTIVNENTQNVLLWIENTDSRRIRKASMGLGIRSQAAVLNEKHVDPELGVDTILRAVDLYVKLSNCKVASKLVDIYPNKPEIKTCTLMQSLVDTYLGFPLDPERIKTILNKLGCQVKINKRSRNKMQDTTYTIEPPSWRAHDLSIPQDYVEEISRIYGYHKIPSKLMTTAIPDNPPTADFHLEQDIINYLSSWGLQEVYSYSMVSRNLALQSGIPINKHLSIKNPFSDDWKFLRRSIIPSHLEIINHNSHLKNIDIFEIANVYHPRKNDLPDEELQLVITSNQEYLHIKGIIDSLFLKLFISNIQIIPVKKAEKPFVDNATGEIYVNKKYLGLIGRISTSSGNVYAAQLSVENLTKLSHENPSKVRQIITPPIIEDLTFTLPEKTYLGEVLETIRKSSKFLEKVKISKIYKRNFTFSLHYRHQTKTLKDKDILPIRKTIVKNLKKEFKAKLIGKLE